MVQVVLGVPDGDIPEETAAAGFLKCDLVNNKSKLCMIIIPWQNTITRAY